MRTSVSPSAGLTRAQAEALEAEALRVYGRYQREFVEALSLCPWAVRAREEGRVAVRACLEIVDDALPSALDAALAIATDETIEVGLLLFPRFAIDRLRHERFVSTLRERDAERHGGSPPLAMAAFHPDADPDFGHPSRLVPFIRRSPDPTIQLVRLSALEAVRKRTGDRGTAFVDPAEMDLGSLLAAPSQAPLHERVAEQNLATVRKVGVAEAEAILAAIRSDRDASYARILGGP